MKQDRMIEQEVSWRHRAHEVIFEADTPAGKLFDVVLLVLIALSVVSVMLESVSRVRLRYGTALRVHDPG